MLHIPILRHGRPYRSADSVILTHHATGEPVAEMSMANSGLIARDMQRSDPGVLERFRMAELIAMFREAARLFLEATLPIGMDQRGQSFEDYLRQLSATTGMPISYCRNNARKIHRVLDEIEPVLAGLMRGVSPETVDRGYGLQDGRMVSFLRRCRVFGAVLPSNSPGVHSLWIPAIALKTPIALKPGREEPWTPLRVITALRAAGVPDSAFGFYPTDHGGAAELLRQADRSMLFGDASTTRPWASDPRVELHGPGYSKVLLGDDCADDWPNYVDMIASSIAANGGRSCINASAVWTPRGGRQLAEALAQKLASITARPADDPNAELAGFANAATAEAINASVSAGLREPGAEDVSARVRGGSRLARIGRVAYLLPTIVRCERPDHPLANREFLFPYASVVECPTREMPERIGTTLIASVITNEREFARRLMAAGNVDRLNLGAIPTWQISWDQPHEGNLFEHLYRQRAFQISETLAEAV